MFSALQRSAANLPERFFAKMAQIPIKPPTEPVLPFAPVAWPYNKPVNKFGPPQLPPTVKARMLEAIKAQSTTPTAIAPEMAGPSAIKPPDPELPKLVVVPAPVAATVVTEEFRIPNREIIRANRVVELQRQCIDIVNQRQPLGCHTMAWAMIPAEVWQGANATFMMMACDFFDASAANTMLLPVTRKGLEQLQLPHHPFKADAELVKTACEEVTKLRLTLAKEHEHIIAAMARGDVSALANRPARKEKFTRDLRQLACKLAIGQFGQEAFDLHQKTFGGALNYESPPPL